MTFGRPMGRAGVSRDPVGQQPGGERREYIGRGVTLVTDADGKTSMVADPQHAAYPFNPFGPMHDVTPVDAPPAPPSVVEVVAVDRENGVIEVRGTKKRKRGKR